MGSICCNKQDIVETQKPRNPDFMIPSAYHYDLRKSFSFIRILNKGGFGQVKLFKDKTFSEAEYAIKTISKESLTYKKFHHIKTEIEIISALNHPNIVNYYCTIETSHNFNLLMEYLGGQPFLKLLTDNRKNFKLEYFRIVLYQVLSALCYLHSNDIVHRDIKPQNILFKMDNDLEIKLIDFGLSFFHKNKDIESIAGTSQYMSPEAYNGKITPKNDIWSMGIIYYIFCFGKFPFVGNNQNDLKEKIINDDIDFENGRLSDIKDEDIVLLKKMLDKDYENRISAHTAIRDDIFKFINTNFFDDNVLIDKYINEFFNQKTLDLIRKYVKSSIIQKTFVFMYVWLAPFKKRSNFRKMFVAIDNYFNYNGYLNSREVFEEFKGRELIEEEEGGKIFSFIDTNTSNKAKELFKIEESSINEEDISKKKTLYRNASNKSLKYKDWGRIKYTTFLSFFYLEEIKNLKNDDEKVKYIFSFFCDRPLCDNPKKEIIDIKGNIITDSQINEIDDIPNTLTKVTFMRFCYKQNLPFKDCEDDINKFFIENPHPIFYYEFKKMIFDDCY